MWGTTPPPAIVACNEWLVSVCPSTLPLTAFPCCISARSLQLGLQLIVQQQTAEQPSFVVIRKSILLFYPEGQ